MPTPYTVTLSDKEEAHLERWAARTNAELGTAFTPTQFLRQTAQAWIDNLIAQNRARRKVKLEEAYAQAADATQTSVLAALGVVDD